MEEAYSFMMGVSSYPVVESNEPMISLIDVVCSENIQVEFSQLPFPTGDARIFYLREGIIDNFIDAAKKMDNIGWIIKVEDGYRSSHMQREIALCEKVLNVIFKKIVWELKGVIPDVEHLLRRITALSATFPKIGTHMSGSAIDISVVSAETGVDIDRGGPYIELSELTPMDSPFISEMARANREKINQIMNKCGFTAYPFEFWHFSKGDLFAEYLSGLNKNAIYGAVDFDIESNEISAINDPMASLHDLGYLQERLKLLSL